ncbi:MAG: M28 family peptidase [Clostridiales bacterium]|jgi:hypothetical protein|nr:M28 family peptidase [Clostridiales bacterium]
MKKFRVPLLGLVIAISIAITGFIVHTPAVGSGGIYYDVKPAINDLQTLAADPHSIANPEELAAVRQYILARFSGMGIKAGTNPYTVNNWYGEYEINNITAQIEGEEGNPSVLIMAHYDSAIENLNMEPTLSTGMADDGYGVATLLQIAEHFSSQDVQLVNGIKFLITDSEEVGPLAGSEAEIQHNLSYYEDVSLVINIEARGFDGAVFMFQAGQGNAEMISLLSEASFPVTSSFFSELIAFIPAFTDLSPFLAQGFSGLNFATVKIKNYHSDEDNLRNLNRETLHHYGIQIMPIVTEFVSGGIYSDARYFGNAGMRTYFTLFPDVVISYGNAVQLVLLGLTAALLIVGVIAARGRENKGFAFRPLLIGIAVNDLVSFASFIMLPGCAYAFVIPNALSAGIFVLTAYKKTLFAWVLGLVQVLISVIVWGLLIITLYYALEIIGIGVSAFLLAAAGSGVVPAQMAVYSEAAQFRTEQAVRCGK